MTRSSNGVWLLVYVGLAGIIALELSSSLPVAPQVAAAPTVEFLPNATPEPVQFEPPAHTVFEEMTARPLFSASRRPFVSPGTEDVPADLAERTITVELVGTLLTGSDRAALLQPAGQGARWVRESQELEGWHVEAIERARVRLRQGDRAETIELRRQLRGDAPLSMGVR